MLKSLNINQELYKLTLGRYANFSNKIKNYSIEIALDIYEDLNCDFESILIFTNSVINPLYIKKFMSKAKSVWIASDSDRVLEQQKFPNRLTKSELEKTSMKFDCILVDIALNFSLDLINQINFYEKILSDNCIFIANILGGKTLYELSNSMMEADLINNRMVARMLPKMSSESLLHMSKTSNFKNAVVMNNELILDYPHLNDVIQSLREIAVVYPHHTYTSKKYWDAVEKIYIKLYKLRASFEFLTLFAVK